MRLIDTTSLQIREVNPSASLRYAILSHRWEEGQEISFQEMLHPNQKTRSKSGYQKIKKFCKRAFDDEDISQLSRSEWFKRGWTLQELLAPVKLQFFFKDWQLLGDKQHLIQTLSCITRIPEMCLKDYYGMVSASVAQKMSWASHRTTTRPEDMAYCLMGLFDVNMPPLYGEGSRAFLRLQEEIIKISNDPSIFAWSVGDSLSFAQAHHELLAESMRYFAGSHDIVGVSRMTKPYKMTHNGIKTTIPMRKSDASHHTAYICAARVKNGTPTEYLGIVLKSIGGQNFKRTSFDDLPVIAEDRPTEVKRNDPSLDGMEQFTIFVPQRLMTFIPPQDMIDIVGTLGP
ncbi:hypothetical protein PENSTE_c014G01785 [Penicillium steckii]|uniref:DUF8212 domain-containing protein n=1 Tax=Penicillium steckii TaxID=303698 RepID=A0A1V6T1F1_9EURO|nr:hypothetical protein PENSTE_c014G01785 [Penicillium steckii]